MRNNKTAELVLTALFAAIIIIMAFTPLGYIPLVVINATIALSEDYVATPEKESAIKSANEKLAKGDQKGAIDTLRLAGIGVIENQYLMPLNQTRKAVAQAQKLLKAGKYYEANLVLKGAEEGIVVDSEMLVAGN